MKHYMSTVDMMYKDMNHENEELWLGIFTRYQIESQDEMWYVTGITEEDLMTFIEKLNMSEDPEFQEKVRRNNIARANAAKKYGQGDDGDFIQ